MPILSLRLPDAIDAWLERAADEAARSKSELARDAIVDYLRRAEREGFLESIARAARSPGGEDPVAVAAEAWRDLGRAPRSGAARRLARRGRCW